MSGGWIVRLPSWLGDTVMAIPTLRALARHVGEPLVFWGPEPYGNLLADTDLRFDFVPFQRRRRLAGLADVVHLLPELRHRAADAALLLPNAFEGALLAKLAGIPRRVGYATDGRRYLLTDPIEPPRASERLHEADRFARLLGALGADPPRPDDHLIAPTERLAARAAAILPAGHDYLGIVAGSANAPAKRWAPSSYAQIIDTAARDGDVRSVLLGSATDRPINREIAALSDAEVIDHSGTPLLDLAATLLRCRVVVSNDTGAAHLAAALGRPTVVLFGPTDRRRTSPRGPHVAPLAAECFCRPCESAACPLDHACMETLAAPAVLDAIKPLWQADA